MGIQRYAIIKLHLLSAAESDKLEIVQSYLPENYSAYWGHDGQIRISGEDKFGWTLDDYVIPRLASGLIFAEEIHREYGVYGLDSDVPLGVFPNLEEALVFLQTCPSGYQIATEPTWDDFGYVVEVKS